MERTHRGAASIVMVAVIALAAASAVGIGRIGSAVVGRARAESLADLVALAAVDADATGAAKVATASGGSLIDLSERREGGVRVRVSLDGHVADAAAESGP